MNAFGWIFATLLILGTVARINEIGKPRKLVTARDVSLSLVLNVLLFLALYGWGIR